MQFNSSRRAIYNPAISTVLPFAIQKCMQNSFEKKLPGSIQDILLKQQRLLNASSATAHILTKAIFENTYSEKHAGRRLSTLQQSKFVFNLYQNSGETPQHEEAPHKMQKPFPSVLHHHSHFTVLS